MKNELQKQVEEILTEDRVQAFKEAIAVVYSRMTPMDFAEAFGKTCEDYDDPYVIEKMKRFLDIGRAVGEFDPHTFLAILEKGQEVKDRSIFGYRA